MFCACYFNLVLIFIYCHSIACKYCTKNSALPNSNINVDYDTEGENQHIDLSDHTHELDEESSASKFSINHVVIPNSNHNVDYNCIHSENENESEVDEEDESESHEQLEVEDESQSDEQSEEDDDEYYNQQESNESCRFDDDYGSDEHDTSTFGGSSTPSRDYGFSSSTYDCSTHSTSSLNI